MTTSPTALVFHPDCALHDTGWGHPEHQGRLPAIIAALVRETPWLQEHVLQVEAAPAGVEEVLRVHAPVLLDRIRAAATAAAAGEPVRLDADTVVSAASWDAALAAAGTVVTAARLVVDGAARTAFAAARPPGHHATRDEAMGFCLFNNVAVAARWLQAERGIDRVLILDWDVHHGNGTQDIFYEDGSVYYLSSHLEAHYPGTGWPEERGAGAGAGTTRNLVLPAGTSGAEFVRLFTRALDETLASFEPGVILVSAGFDCLAGDPLGGLLVEPRDLHALTTVIRDRAEACCGGRVVVALEGGYVPRRVGAGVVEVVRALAGLPASG